MSKNVSLLGADYPDVPAVVLPQTGGGSATFTDVSETTATDSDVMYGKSFFGANGQRQSGSLITHNVYDGLDSTSTDDALSANQGKVLDEKIDSHFQALNSGSLHDITTPGIYYLRNAVTDKPTSTGGIYIVSSYSGTIAGIFISVASDKAYIVTYISGTWTYTQLANA